MPLYDFECECGRIFESIVATDVYDVDCTCGKRARRIVSVSGQYTGNQDAPWIRSVLEVVDKESKKSHCVEFRKNPTRENYKKWLKGEGLRPMDSNVRGAPPTYQRQEIDNSKARQQAYEKHRERRRLEVR